MLCGTFHYAEEYNFNCLVISVCVLFIYDYVKNCLNCTSFSCCLFIVLYKYNDTYFISMTSITIITNSRKIQLKNYIMILRFSVSI